MVRTGSVCKPGRSLCQYVALHLYLAQLAAQVYEFLSFSSTEGTGLTWHYAIGFIGQAHPAQNTGGVAAEFFG